MLKETFSMRKIGKHLVNVSMLGLAVAPIAGSALAPVTVLAAEQGETRKVEKIPFKTETKEDPTLPKGEKKVIQKGVEGEKEIVTSTKANTKQRARNIILWIDESGSFQNAGGHDYNESLATSIINSLGPNDKMMILGNENTDDMLMLTYSKIFAEPTNDKSKLLAALKKTDGSARSVNVLQNGSMDSLIKAMGVDAKDITLVSLLDDTAITAGQSKTPNYLSEFKSKGGTILGYVPQVPAPGSNKPAFASSTEAALKAVGAKVVKPVEYRDGNAPDVAKQIVDSISSETVTYEPVTTEKVIKEPVNEIIAIGSKEAEPVKPAESTKRTEEIPFKTETKEDPTLPEGEKKVVQKGEKGLREFTTTPDVTGNVTGKVDFDIKAGTSTSKESARKPVDLLAIIDTSSSMVENYGRALTSAEALVKSMTNDDQITFAHYYTNGLDSYNTGEGKADGPSGRSQPMLLGVMTTPMKKSEALKYLTDAKNFKVGANGVQFINFIDAQEKLGYKFQKENGKGFQDVYMAHHKTDSTISVIQFTDGWMNTESIDTDFAAWATKNAKTFMTVSFKNNSGANGGPTDFSVVNMKKAGHSNIYDERTTAIDDAAIEKQFESTATEKITVTKQDVNIDVTLTIPKDAKLESAELVTPNGPVKMDIKDNVAVYSGKKVADGHYSLTYKVSGGNGDVKVVVTKDGKELASKSDKLTTTKGSSTDKIIKQPVNEIIAIGTKGGKSEVTEKKVPFETIRKDDPTLEEGQEKVVQEGVEGVIKVTTTYETQKGEKVKGSEKVTETEAVKKVDKIIAVGTKGSKSEVTEKKVPFETIYKQDPTLKKGEEKVLQEGVEGVIKVTTTYETQKGKKVDGSEKVTEETVTEKVDKIVAQGSMEKRKVRYRVVDSKGQELVKQTDVMEAYQDEEYKVETPKLDGYRLELAKDSVPATGKVADRDVLVTFVAVKIGKPVTLKFVDESGSEIAQKKVLTGENVDVDTEFSGEAPETIEKDGVKYAFVGIKQTGSKERKVSGKVTDQEQVLEAVYAKPKELPKTSEQAKQRNTAIIALLSVVGLGGLATYLGLRKRDEK